jgi:hypothetical protein
MKRVTELTGRELRWMKAGSGSYALRDGEDTVATLRFPSTWRTLATAESADGCWTFKRTGFMRTRAIIRACDGDEELASFKNNILSHSGTLELSDGQRLQGDTNIWMTKFNFSRETGEPLVRFTSIGGVFSWHSSVEVLPSAAALRGAPWLVMLGWYLSIQMRKDAAAG